ncbi:DEAD/DEAH box helicase family protein [Paenibacillus sp. JCM 10914]|uniref:DEAD/DEAH box helicase family protein n=1 Tax=Paenibacillus sp. JCM 10914 TaxID=1236974 RepID=UPI00056128BD|nr:DEAD/DEAH box helicase family protein [Paenibacillus sp. JCM 10914]
MKSFPDHLSFRYTWRSYQKRILDGLDEHLKNRHLHLVAPPGSGKTVLGLEVMLRINRPTIILAPTLTIKQQWASRFVELFLPDSEDTPDWISTSLKQPALVTITTYRALHRLLSTAGENNLPEDGDGADPEPTEEAGQGDDLEEINSHTEALETIRQWTEIGVHTLIFDEAHHLRVSWWQSAMQLCSMLDQPTKIALTATPPYDVSPREWQRYIELCGPIDEEISVPELVRHGELCPHQDYISLTTPTSDEASRIRKFRTDAAQLKDDMVQNAFLANLLVHHPWIAQSNTYIEDILSSPGYYSSMVIYLRAADQPEWKEAVKLLGMKEKEVPDFTEEWLEELLTGVLYRDPHVDHEQPEIKAWQKHMSRMGMIERRRVYLRSTPAFDKMLVQSVSKLHSIGRILDFERSVLEERLRMVILTDYIRKDDLPRHGDDLNPLTRLGVVPIFEMIRRQLLEAGKLKLADRLPIGILTGSFVVLPASALPLATEGASRRGVQLSTKPLVHDERFVTVDVRDSNRSTIVAIVTEVFAQGEIEILVGTAALLGEGWDAPGINSLIMASYVGSFMLSNQMRGRAIRTQRGNPDKTGAIWHLACVDTSGIDGGEDLASLARRFRSLVGLSVTYQKIESGMDRMGLDVRKRQTARSIDAYNQDTLRRAKERHLLKERWDAAIGLHSSMTEELTVTKESMPRPYIFSHTIKAVFMFGIFLAIGAWGEAVLSPRLLSMDAPTWFKMLIPLVIALLVSSPWIYKAIKMKVRHRSLDRSIRQVGLAVYSTLYRMELMGEEPSIHRIKAEEEGGAVVCWLRDGSTQEKTVFLLALQQVLDPIENPRYLLYRESKSWFVTKRDYHAVPEEIGRRKENAERFVESWRKHVGPAELVYTRTPEGRKMLLTARTKALSSMFVHKSDRISAWR